jgi:hypothetical protein
MFGSVLAFTGFGVSGSDNREWIHRQNVPAWVVQLFSAKGQVYRRSCAEKGRAAENRFGEAIQVEKSESGGGLIRWNGKNTSGSSTATDFDFSGVKRACWHPLRIKRFAVEDETYFGERMSAWVLISCLCFSTTRRSSRSMVLKAS